MSDSHAPSWVPVRPAPPTGPQAPALSPDSALVRTAVDLVRQHEPNDHGHCARCDLIAPCPSAVHARQVVESAGLDPNHLPEPILPVVEESVLEGSVLEESVLEEAVAEEARPRAKRTSGKRNHRVRTESEQVALAS